MADINEVFRIIEDANGEGQALLARTDGGQLASLGNHAGVLAYKDSAGNDVKPQLTAGGAIVVDTGGAAGTAAFASAKVETVTINTEQDVVALTVGNSESISCSQAMGSSFKPTEWVLYHDDNSTLNELARFVTGSGDFNHNADLKNISFTSGATGTQRVVLRSTQKRGPATDNHGTISILNLG